MLPIFRIHFQRRTTVSLQTKPCSEQLSLVILTMSYSKELFSFFVLAIQSVPA